MKQLFIIFSFAIFQLNISAQNTEKVVGQPELSKFEIGIQRGSTSSIGGGILISFNRYLSEKNILHFNFTPYYAASSNSFLGTFEFWNEYRNYLGKRGTFYLSHGPEFNLGDRNKNLLQVQGEPIKSKFAVGLGYGLGIGQVINERLTFTANVKYRYNYVTTWDNGVSSEFKPEINLSIGVNYRFK
ncbi:hypothetical protein [Portibacter lacus]|uniref:Uncharacterized protein n=1 Tax=Portibacter lacus TaxID=1099794 RepID=A0AA37SKI5_9BACT|nr:hypothetical protein [Portibacter lacus]GLR16343.1 hypothetical protein GCM10007940_09580 [Portibacter lacus]